MQTITLNIPESLLINRAISFGELRMESQFVLAAHLYQNGYLTYIQHPWQPASGEFSYEIFLTRHLA